ncbi:MAG: glycosyltransferase [Deltaproteobacteria bacterium]|jgi:glycosyltransferase involved in cell wall biosynthesis|nr:glycosyltransferase [Deltaproteobacteria bacterium]
MGNITPLFISYFYPPAGGTGLPGAQRSVKFIRYLQNPEAIYVLSVQPECYPENVQLNFNLSLPVNGETIIRTESQDRFLTAMRLRARLAHMFKKQNSGVPTEELSESSFSYYGAEADFSLVQRIKDFIFNTYYFPDQIAAPWINPAVQAGLTIVRKNKINVIFATGMPWTALVVGRKISKKTGVPFIADFRDPWLGNPFLKSKGKFLDWRERVCERKIVQEAAIVSANTEPLRKEFVNRYPNIPSDKIICLPNGFDPHDFDHISPARYHNKSTSKKLILAHAGFLYGKRDPAPLLKALELLCQHHPGLANMVEFQQIGWVTLEYDIEKRFGALIDKGLVKLLGQLPYDECLERLTEVDILLIIQPGTKTQVPSKLYDYLCINRPILTITSPDGALGEMIRENKFGELFAPEEEQLLMEKLVELSEMKRKDKLMPADYPGREKFNVLHIARQLENKMKQIVGVTAEKK